MVEPNLLYRSTFYFPKYLAVMVPKVREKSFVRASKQKITQMKFSLCSLRSG